MFIDESKNPFSSFGGAEWWKGIKNLLEFRNSERVARIFELRSINISLVRQGKLGVSNWVQVPVEEGLTNHSYRVLQP